MVKDERTVVELISRARERAEVSDTPEEIHELADCLEEVIQERDKAIRERHQACDFKEKLKTLPQNIALLQAIEGWRQSEESVGRAIEVIGAARQVIDNTHASATMDTLSDHLTHLDLTLAWYDGVGPLGRRSEEKRTSSYEKATDTIGALIRARDYEEGEKNRYKQTAEALGRGLVELLDQFNSEMGLKT